MLSLKSNLTHVLVKTALRILLMYRMWKNLNLMQRFSVLIECCHILLGLRVVPFRLNWRLWGCCLILLCGIGFDLVIFYGVMVLALVLRHFVWTSRRLKDCWLNRFFLEQCVASLIVVMNLCLWFIITALCCMDQLFYPSWRSQASRLRRKWQGKATRSIFRLMSPHTLDNHLRKFTWVRAYFTSYNVNRIDYAANLIGCIMWLALSPSVQSLPNSNAKRCGKNQKWTLYGLWFTNLFNFPCHLTVN